MYRCWSPSLAGVWLPQVHGPCAHNLVHGLLARTMGPTPEMTPGGAYWFRRKMGEVRRILLGRIDVSLLEQWDFDRVVASYSEKRLRVRYEEARLSLATDGLCVRRDAKVSAFVKGEKLANYKVHKPRVIMGRSPRYNLELASYLKPVEHAVYPGLRGWGRQFLTHTRLVGKGLNGEQRASLLRRKMLSAPELVCFELDGVSFESHFCETVLKAEHSLYTSLLKDPRLGELLGWQVEFEGQGCGVKYKVKGVRASGDFNTGLGNTLVMCCLVLMTAEHLKGCRFDFLADGDNAVVFVEKRHLDLWLRALPSVVLEAGFQVTIENPVERFEEIVFGQSKPCFADGRWTMVRNPFKVLSHGACGFQHFADMRGGLRVLKAIGYCEAVLSRGVPVLQEYAHALLEATRGVSFSKAVLDDFEYKRVLAQGIRWSDAVKRTITAEARESFAISWGVSVEEQLRMERQLKAVPKIPVSWSDVPLECEMPDGRDHWTLVSHRHSHFGDLLDQGDQGLLQ